jgi:predicted DNA-binding transcriptional regulator AlpA
MAGRVGAARSAMPSCRRIYAALRWCSNRPFATVRPLWAVRTCFMTKHRATTNEEPANTLAAMADLNVQAAEVSARLHADGAALALLHRQMAELVVRLCTTSQRQMPAAPSTPARMLRIADVVRRVGPGRSTVWRMVQEKTFPSPRDSARGLSRGLRARSPTGCSTDRRCDDLSVATIGRGV